MVYYHEERVYWGTFQIYRTSLAYGKFSPHFRTTLPREFEGQICVNNHVSKRKNDGATCFNHSGGPQLVAGKETLRGVESTQWSSYKRNTP